MVKYLFFNWLFIVLFLLLIATFQYSIYAGLHPEIPFHDLPFLQYFIILTQFYKPTLNFFASIIGLISTLISIAIPLTINKVADCLKPYKDRDIQRMFLKDRIFQQMIFVIVLLVFSLCFWLFVFDPMIIGFVLLSFGILSLYVFYRFLMRVIEYVTSTDDVVLDELWLNLENILNDE